VIFGSKLTDSWPDSVWSTVPRLCLEEKGYSKDEYVLKLVDISKSDLFVPSLPLTDQPREKCVPLAPFPCLTA
jgi:hypothetical protein